MAWIWLCFFILVTELKYLLPKSMRHWWIRCSHDHLFDNRFRYLRQFTQQALFALYQLIVNLVCYLWSDKLLHNAILMIGKFSSDFCWSKNSHYVFYSSFWSWIYLQRRNYKSHLWKILVFSSHILFMKSWYSSTTSTRRDPIS